MHGLFHPFLGIAMRLKARNAAPDEREKVIESLRIGRRQATFNAIDDYFYDNAPPEMMAAIAGASAEAWGDGTILKIITDFLDAHWADILAIILKLLPH